MFEKIGDKEFLYNKVAKQIMTAILKGHYKNGDKLPTEREFTKIFRVSRPVIRHALKTLEVIGLTRVKSRCGIFVDDFDWAVDPNQKTNLKADIFDVLHGRRIFETQAVFYATQRASNKQRRDIKEFISLTDQWFKHAINENDSLLINEYNKLFHINLARASGNNAFVWGISYLFRLFEQGQVKLKLSPEGIIRTFEEHEEIARAFIYGEPEIASKQMYNHLLNIENELRVSPKINRDLASQ